MSEANYRPSGELQGDTKAIPSKGTGTGMNGDTYGADLGPDATGRIGGIGGSTKSDPGDEGLPSNKGLKR